MPLSSAVLLCAQEALLRSKHVCAHTHTLTQRHTKLAQTHKVFTKKCFHRLVCKCCNITVITAVYYHNQCWGTIGIKLIQCECQLHDCNDNLVLVSSSGSTKHPGSCTGRNLFHKSLQGQCRASRWPKSHRAQNDCIGNQRLNHHLCLPTPGRVQEGYGVQSLEEKKEMAAIIQGEVSWFIFPVEGRQFTIVVESISLTWGSQPSLMCDFGVVASHVSHMEKR